MPSGTCLRRHRGSCAGREAQNITLFYCDNHESPRLRGSSCTHLSLHTNSLVRSRDEEARTRRKMQASSYVTHQTVSRTTAKPSAERVTVFASCSKPTCGREMCTAVEQVLVTDRIYSLTCATPRGWKILTVPQRTREFLSRL